MSYSTDRYDININDLKDHTYDQWVSKVKPLGYLSLFDAISNLNTNTGHEFRLNNVQRLLLNKRKRYEDDFIISDHAVKLSNNDFIDASHVLDHYIAASSPINIMIPDWWRMVWEQNVTIIVMLTGYVEKNVLKADKYFGEINKNITYGDFTVKLINIDMNPTYKININKIRVVNNKTNKSRIITHIHYTGWADMGIPPVKEMYRLLNDFIKIRNNEKSENITKKVLIHCSAGVGRTGTFLTILELLKDLQNNRKNINFVKKIVELRNRRIGMVQTDEQLGFIYQFIRLFCMGNSL